MDVTLEYLEQLGACAPARTAFQARFPHGATWRELLIALSEHERGIAWWHWLYWQDIPALESAQMSYRDCLWEHWQAADFDEAETAYEKRVRFAIRRIADRFFSEEAIHDN